MFKVFRMLVIDNWQIRHNGGAEMSLNALC